MSELGDALTARYTSRLQALRDQVRGAVGSLYRDTVTPDDLDAAFAALTTRITPLVRAGQARGVALSGAYLQVLVAIEGGRTSDLSPFSAGIVGTTKEGLALEAGMAAWPSMVKQQIGKGVPLEQALSFGSYLAERFADAEVTSAVDRHTEAVTQQSGQFSGWIGVIAGTCDLCREQNSGTHALGEPVYRHPNCKCTKQFVVEGAVDTEFPLATLGIPFPTKPPHPDTGWREPFSRITLKSGIKAKVSPYGDAVPGGYNGGWALFDAKTGTKMGFLDYQSGGRSVTIGMIEVMPAFRGKGVSDALLSRLIAEFPGITIDPGMLTEAGVAWWKRVKKFLI